MPSGAGTSTYEPSELNWGTPLNPSASGKSVADASPSTWPVSTSHARSRVNDPSVATTMRPSGLMAGAPPSNSSAGFAQTTSPVGASLANNRGATSFVAPTTVEPSALMTAYVSS